MDTNEKDLNEDLNMFKSVTERISKSKPLPNEFGEVIEENFWDLVEDETRSCKPKIFTTYFSNLKNIINTIVPISIARFAPKGWKETGGLSFPKLYPPVKLLLDRKGGHVSDKDYILTFKHEVLDHLDPHCVVKDLYDLTNGRIPCLVCYEKLQPSPYKFRCHRELVTRWLSDNGYMVEEI